MYADDDTEYLTYLNLDEIEQDSDLDIDKNRILINLYFLFFFLLIVFIYTNYVNILEDNVRMLTKKIKCLKRPKNKWTFRYVGSDTDSSDSSDCDSSGSGSDSSGSGSDSSDSSDSDSDSSGSDSSDSSDSDSSGSDSSDSDIQTELESSDDDVYNFRTFNRSKSIGELPEDNKLNRVYTRSMSGFIKKRN